MNTFDERIRIREPRIVCGERLRPGVLIRRFKTPRANAIAVDRQQDSLLVCVVTETIVAREVELTRAGIRLEARAVLAVAPYWL
jgi:hypothetical protein